MRCVSEQVSKIKARKPGMLQDFSENVSCLKARAAHDAVCEHGHKIQFHGDKWPKNRVHTNATPQPTPI